MENLDESLNLDQKYEYEYGGEQEISQPVVYPKEVDIDDGIERCIKIKSEIFGVIYQYETKLEVMRFTLTNKEKDGISLQVSSLGAAVTGIKAPDRKNIYEDIVLGFDDVDSYFEYQNPGFGRIMSLCPLPCDLAKIVWDWDFDRDEGSVTFSTAFPKIDVVLTVKYSLNVDNEITVDIKACGAKILPISLTNQIFWNLAGHSKGEEAMKHHVLSLNSSVIWSHDSHKLQNFISVAGTDLDFRIPTMMDNPKLFGDNHFQHVYLITKGSKQGMCFLARLIHPRTCRFVEIYSDHPWMICNTFNEMPKYVPKTAKMKETEIKDGKKTEMENKSEISMKNMSDIRMKYMSKTGISNENETLMRNNSKGKYKTSDIELGGEDKINELEGKKLSVEDNYKGDYNELGGKREDDEERSESESDESETSSSEESVYLEEILGKENSVYKKYGSFCITPSSDLSGFDPLLRPGKSYSHKIVYKIGIYRRYMKSKTPKSQQRTEETEEMGYQGITDIEKE